MPQSSSLVCSHSPRKSSARNFESSSSIVTSLDEERDSVSLGASNHTNRTNCTNRFTRRSSNKPQSGIQSYPFVRVAFEVVHLEYGEVMQKALGPSRLGVLNFLVQIVGVKLAGLRILHGPLQHPAYSLEGPALRVHLLQ